MSSPRQVQTLSAEDAAYLAGVIDGEGTITLSRRHRNDNRQLVVSISSTEAELLIYIRRAIGVGRITHKRISRAHHTPSFTYAIANRQALALLEQISPYLRTYKSQRAALVLRDYIRLTPRNGKYTLQQQREREAFIQRFLSVHPIGSARQRSSLSPSPLMG